MGVTIEQQGLPPSSRSKFWSGRGLHPALPRAIYAGFAGGAPSALKGGVLDLKAILIMGANNVIIWLMLGFPFGAYPQVLSHTNIGLYLYPYLYSNACHQNITRKDYTNLRQFVAEILSDENLIINRIKDIKPTSIYKPNKSLFTGLNIIESYPAQ